jgi:tetratricopeptide (TPR) repeat protein
MNADQVIYGTYRVDPSSGMLSVDATVSDRAQARLADLAEENGVLTNLDRVEAHLAWQALSVIAPAAAPAEDAFQTLRPAVRVNAEESFIKGLVAPNGEKEKYFLQAVRADTRFARPMLELGKIELARKNNRAAAEWFTKIDPADPLAAEAGFYLGVAKFRDRDYLAAQTAYEKIRDLLPSAEVFNNLGVAESRRGQMHALASFREALDLNPNHTDYHFNLGYILFKTGQYEAAAERFRAVLDREPNDAMATSLLGRALKSEGLRKGNPADARYENLERFKESFERPYFRVAGAGASAER